MSLHTRHTNSATKYLHLSSRSLASKLCACNEGTPKSMSETKLKPIFITLFKYEFHFI